MTGIDRRKHDDEFKDKMIAFMSRIDERNFNKDLAYAIQGDLVIDHETRITSLETSRTQLNTIAKGLTLTGALGFMIKKFGHYFGG